MYNSDDFGMSVVGYENDSDSSSRNDSSEESLQNNAYRLEYFPSALFASILEDTIKELRILAECNNELRIIRTMADFKMLLAKKYNIAQPVSTDELEGIDPKNLGLEVYKLNKLSDDRNYITNTLLKLYLDLSLRKNFAVLPDAINTILLRESYRDSLVEDEAKNRLTRRDLTRQLRQQRNHIKTVNYDTDVAIDLLKTKVEDCVTNSEVRSRYIGNWQHARTEQHLHLITITEKPSMLQIDYYKQEIDQEQRIHAEIDLIINLITTELLEKIDKMMYKYDTDMEALDLKIQIMKNDYQKTLDERLELEKTYEVHKELIAKWIKFKEDREKSRQYHEKLTRAAITVQSWWRGLMVRQKLGPYNKVSKKKGGGKKK